jgi:hypothetical protein
MFPASTVSVLAISTHEDQAVMTSTLGLWRNLGTVMGVAISSLIVQNGLVVYLDQYITGPDKFDVGTPVESMNPALKFLDYPAGSKISVNYTGVGWFAPTRR